RLLVSELQQMGVKDAHLDEFGYVYATIPSNVDREVPVICFCSHVDTSPDCSGKGVKPLLHENYQGHDIVLPDDPSVVIRFAEHPDLQEQMGHDIITASGTTLLGADDKAGIAEIMEAVRLWMAYPEIKHGEIKLLFTPDEEIGRGVDQVDLEKLGAQFGYTMHGEKAGTIAERALPADAGQVRSEGRSGRPGLAKGKMVRALRRAADLVARWPQDSESPGSTCGEQGFIPPTECAGGVDRGGIGFI